MKKELIGIWNVQYKPRHQVLMFVLKGAPRRRYIMETAIEKMRIIDSFQAKGYFN